MTHIQGLNRLKGHADTAITGLPNGFALMPPHHVRPIQYRAFPSKRFAVDHFFLISVRDSCPQKTERAAADSGPLYFIQAAFIVPLAQYVCANLRSPPENCSVPLDGLSAF